MKNQMKICAMVTALSVATLSVSLTTAPPEARAAVTDVQEADAEQAAAIPAILVGGLVVAFGIGFAQGYMEAKNAQGGTEPAPTEPAPTEQMAQMAQMEFDYVLN